MNRVPCNRLHDWRLSPAEAAELQRKLAPRVRMDLRLPPVRRVAGIDVAYRPETNESIATVAILSYPELTLEEVRTVRTRTEFPYVPGLLSFREMPAILAAWGLLDGAPPELILVDGQGRAHPRRFGLACHLGLWLRLPSIGVAKTRLCGQFVDPGAERGAASDLIDKAEVIGRVVRTRQGVKPLFVSIGYGLPLEECVSWVVKSAPRFRIPEPIRQAHRLSALGKRD